MTAFSSDSVTLPQNTRLASSGNPSFVGSLPGRFDPLKHLYVPSASDTRRIDAKLAAARAGLGTAHIVACGDSETAGYNSTPTTAWPMLLRGWISAAGFPVGGTGLAYADSTGNGADSRWTWDPAYTTSTGFFRICTAASKVATFVADQPGTSVDVWFFGNGLRGATISVDGGTAQTYTPSGISKLEKVTISGLSSANHTVTITSGATAGNLFIVGVNCYGPTGVQVHTAGVSGQSTTTWWNNAGGFSSWYNQSVAYTPDLVVIALGVNEIIKETTSVGQYVSQYIALGNKYRSIGATVMMMVEPQPSAASNGRWQQQVAAQYQISEALGARMVDLYDRWGSFATANANGLMSDLIHPNPTGYSDMAFAARQLILPQ